VETFAEVSCPEVLANSKSYQDLLKLIERVVLKPQVASGISNSKVFQEKEQVPPAVPVVV